VVAAQGVLGPRRQERAGCTPPASTWQPRLETSRPVSLAARLSFTRPQGANPRLVQEAWECTKNPPLTRVVSNKSF
jgi:hypothetical protein